ncbi:MAG: amidohydrolase [Tenericutes bacterium HGW-Tenericutes-1]|jgi:cytosine/adenosine deaminase-related metal-dependent hydrolase|nr:MAG: amidohydrolase [Tenericutes bacterium HGW-Tenericutes-1]
MVKALINATLYDRDRFLKNAYVLFDKQIFEVGLMKEFINHNYELIDCENHIVMPSFVLAHTHIYSTFARGLSLPFNPSNFQEILDQLWWKLDSQIDNDISYCSGIVYGSDCIKNGITTIIDHHASKLDIYNSLNSVKKAIVDTLKLRGCFCFETSDRFDVDMCIRENAEFALNNHTSHSRGLFGLHASMSLSEETLKKVKDNLGMNPIHIHVSESQLDELDSMNQYHESVIERLNRHGLLLENSLLIHCVHISEKDMDIIKEKNCKVVVNLTSNMNNAVGLPDMMKMKEKGICVLVGNDGLGSSIVNEFQAIYYLMHHQTNSPTAFTLNDLLDIIENNYQYASQLFDVKLGRIDVKYEADFQIIPYIPPTPLNHSNAFGHLFFGLFNSFKPRHVFVSGIQVLKDYQLDKNIDTLYASAENQAEILWNRLKKENV